MKISKLVLVALSLVTFGSTKAANETAIINVTLTIQESCIFTATRQDISFGTHNRSETSLTAQGKLSYQCTAGTAPKIALASSNGWNLKNADVVIPYKLYSDSQYSTVWNDQDGNTVTKTASGHEDSVNVYGKISAANATNVKAGDYADTVTATITF